MAEQDPSLINALIAIFSKSTISWVIPALRREPAVWSELSQPEFLQAVQEQLGNQETDWTPTRIGLLAVALDTKEALPWPITSFKAFSPEISQRVVETYRAVSEDHLPLTRLSDLTCLGLSLWGERESGKTWQDLITNNKLTKTWRAALTCTFDLVSKPLDFLKALPASSAIHILFSQPRTPQNREDALLKYLPCLDPGQQVAWLRCLQTEQAAMTRNLAQRLVQQSNGQPKGIQETILRAELHQLAGDSQQSLHLYQQASQLNHQLQRTLSANLNKITAGISTDPLEEEGWRELLDLIQNRDEIDHHGDEIAEVIHTLLKQGHLEAADQLISALNDPLPQHPALLTAMAAFAKQEQADTKAGELALLALEKTNQSQFLPQRLPPLLLEIGLAAESMEISRKLLEEHPNHIPTLESFAEALHRVGNHPEAARKAEIVCLLKPEDLSCQKQLAWYLEQADMWDQALEVRSRILGSQPQAKQENTPVLPADDLLAFANCANQSGHQKRSAAAAGQVLHQHPEDGRAHAILGKSLIAMDRQEEGFHHLEKAVARAPELEESWISLANALAADGKTNRAKKTLQMGIKAAQKHAKLHFTLGQLHAQQGALADALNEFQKAQEEIEDHEGDHKAAAKIICSLGQTYFELGHLEKAHQTLKNLHKKYPEYQDGNLLFGQVLLASDQPGAALPYLEKAVEGKPNNPDPFLYFADAQLRLKINPAAAEDALQKALEMDPDNHQAIALMGEAQSAGGDLQKALITFQKALETPLNRDPSWGPRIMLGLGNTALGLEKTDTALATLKEAHTQFPDHLGLIRSLAEAYRSAELPNHSLELIHKATETAPDKSEILSWIADFSLTIDAPEEAVGALEKLIKIHPTHHAYYLQLGKAQAAAGREQKAIASFSLLAKQEDVDPEFLYQAGELLIKLGELDPGINSLFKAASIAESSPDHSDLLPKINARISTAYELNGESQQALRLLDKAIEADLENPSWRVQKSDLLVKMEKYQAAIASLENALELRPKDPRIHYKMAQLFSKIDPLEKALNHAQEAVSGYLAGGEVQDSQLFEAAALAADLAAGKLKNDQADQILSSVEFSACEDQQGLDTADLHALCLKAELALDQQEEVEAAEIGNQLVSCAASHPRVMTLQARILSRQGNLQEAQTILKEAILKHKEKQHLYQRYPSATEVSFGKTARELNLYGEALLHLQHAVRYAPCEYRALVNIIETLIERAETYRFSNSLRIVHHTPPLEAISSDAWKLFASSLQSLEQNGYSPALITQYQKRGKAAFTPNLETAQALQTSATGLDEKAAVIAALRHCRQLNLAAETALDELDHLGESAVLDAQIALATLKLKPEISAQAAKAALKTAKKQQQPLVPSYCILLAMVEYQRGNLDLAAEAANSALEIWPDEPRWYALAAEIALHPDQSIPYLEKAIQLEPGFAGHYLALGKAQLTGKKLAEAVTSLEEAVSLNEDLLEAWLLLAESHRQLKAYQQALDCTAKVLSIADEHLPARKAAAKICLERGDFNTAERHLITLLGQDAHDTEAMLLLAKALAAQKQTDQALKIVDKALSLAEDDLDLALERISLLKTLQGPYAAIDALRMTSSRFPDEFRLMKNLVDLLAEAGETAQAIRTAQEILQQGQIGHTLQQKGQLQLTTGRLLRSAGQLDQAVHYLHQAKKVENVSYEAALELGRVHQDRRQYEQALDQIQKAIQISPQDAEAYYQAGKVLKELKQYERAERMLRHAAKLAPHDLKIHRQLGVLVTLNLVHGDPKPAPIS